MMVQMAKYVRKTHKPLESFLTTFKAELIESKHGFPPESVKESGKLTFTGAWSGPDRLWPWLAHFKSKGRVTEYAVLMQCWLILKGSPVLFEAFQPSLQSHGPGRKPQDDEAIACAYFKSKGLSYKQVAERVFPNRSWDYATAKKEVARLIKRHKTSPDRDELLEELLEVTDAMLGVSERGDRENRENRDFNAFVRREAGVSDTPCDSD
jgi:hypothetical protein